MRTIANIIWHVPFCGFINSIITFVIGSILVITIVAAPIGLGMIQYAKFLMKPFSSKMVSASEINQDGNVLWKSYGFLLTILYFPIGLILAFLTLGQIILLFISIVGIPLGIILAKSLGTILNPVNKVCVAV